MTKFYSGEYQNCSQVSRF